MWSTEEPRLYYPMVQSPDHSESHSFARTKNPQKAKTMNVRAHVEPPSREELQRLKEVLGISQGSLQYKKRGQGIYHVVYAEEKHHWNHLGSWKELRQKLDV